MKKGKILFVGLVGLLLAVVMFLAGCNAGCPRSGGDCNVSIDSTGSTYAGFATCGNNDCAATKARSKGTPGKHNCNCY